MKQFLTEETAMLRKKGGRGGRGTSLETGVRLLKKTIKF